jgi:hypothetical protein
MRAKELTAIVAGWVLETMCQDLTVIKAESQWHGQSRRLMKGEFEEAQADESTYCGQKKITGLGAADSARNGVV